VNDKLTISKRSLKAELSMGAGNYIIHSIVNDLINFFRFSVSLQNNPENKKTTLFNLQILSNLQRESYDNFIRVVDIISNPQIDFS
jgi:hypothetical protein